MKDSTKEALADFGAAIIIAIIVYGIILLAPIAFG